MNGLYTKTMQRYCRMAIVLLMLMLAGLTMANTLQRSYSVNYAKLDVTTVLRSISDMTGANILVKPGVIGEVSLRLTNKSLEEILDAVAMLTASEYTYDNGIYVYSKIQPITTPIKKEDVKVDFVQLSFVSTEDIVAVLALAWPTVEVKPFPSSNNRLILRGSEDYLTQAKAMIAQLDVKPASSEAVTKEVQYTLRSLVPWQAKEYLEKMYGEQGLTVTFIPNPQWKPEQAMAEETPATDKTPTDEKSIDTQPSMKWASNQLVLRGPGMTVDLAIANLEKIDGEAPVTKVRCSVKRIVATQAISYLLQEYEKRGLTIVTAPMTINALQGAVTNNSQLGMKVSRDLKGQLNVSEPVGDFYLLGPADVVTDAQTALATIDVGPAKVLRVVSVRFLHIKEAKTRLDEIFQNQGLQVFIAPAQKGETPQMATETGEGSATKALDSEEALMRISDLLLSGPEDVVDQAEQLLLSLDKESDQISISSQVISITKGEVTTLGVEWPSSIAGKFTEAYADGPLRIGRILRDPISLNTTLNMLQTKNRARVLSQPSTVVQNGREATIHVGEKVLYETVASYTNGVPSYTVQSIDTGVTLVVLPQMSHDGIITLAITCVVSELSGFTKAASGADLPQIKETKTRTTVQVRDNETLIIGGLTQHQLTVTEKGVPILSQIPLLGEAFKSKTTRPSSSDLMIMVTPRALKNDNSEPTIETPPNNMIVPLPENK